MPEKSEKSDKWVFHRFRLCRWNLRGNTRSHWRQMKAIISDESITLNFPSIKWTFKERVEANEHEEYAVESFILYTLIWFISLLKVQTHCRRADRGRRVSLMIQCDRFRLHRIELGAVTQHNYRQLKVLNSVVFPVIYNDKFYQNVLEVWTSLKTFQRILKCS